MSPHLFARKAHRRLICFSNKLIQWPRILLYRMISSAQIQGKPILHQPMQVVGLGAIRFNGNVNIGVFPSPFFFSTSAYIEARNSSAEIDIGDGTWINNGFSAVAEHTFIKIGKRVLIGSNVEIYDSNFHGIRVTDRASSIAEWAQPVVIEDDVFLGANVRVLKGVTIGRGSVVANSSVVVSDIPPNVIAGGIPARVLKAIEE